MAIKGFCAIAINFTDNIPAKCMAFLWRLNVVFEVPFSSKLFRYDSKIGIILFERF